MRDDIDADMAGDGIKPAYSHLLKTSKLYRSLVVGVGASALFATVAHCADLGYALLFAGGESFDRHEKWQ